MLLELGVGADILRGIGWLIWLLIAAALVVAFTQPKTKLGKAVAVSLVLGVVASIFVPEAIRQYEHKRRYAKAKALFDERCKTAGEKIYRTVEDVEGIFLKNIRPAVVASSSQYDSDDQYGHNVGGEKYIAYYLIGSSDSISRYRFVEAINNGVKLRYSTPLSAEISREYWSSGGGEVTIDTIPIQALSAQYSVEWKDVSTKEDRDQWIAGGRIQIKDMATGEVLGERTGYLWETGFGSTAGERAPWAWARYYANSCPSLKLHNRTFVEKVLKPSKGD